MLSQSIPTLPALILGLLIGLGAMTLVANELGKRIGLPIAARPVLASGLGLGVLAIGIKIIIIATFAQVDGKTLADAGSASRAAIEALIPELPSEAPDPGISTAPSTLRTWRPLPTVAPAPRNNPTTPEKVALGRALFYDTDLSLDRSIACASCHVLDHGGDDDASFATGIDGQKGNRNAPTVLNAAFLSRLFWDGRAPSLEKQAKGPFVNPVEMAMPSLAAVAERVREKPEYRRAFARVFGEDAEIDGLRITRAIAAYERTLITPNTPYDRFVRGEDDALSPAVLRGMALFQEVGCRNCHLDPVFSSAGVEKPFGIYRPFPVFTKENPFLETYDLLIEGRSARYRVPSLRNVALTAPYFHNGSVQTLEEAVRVMVLSQLGRTLSNDPVDDLLIISARVDDTSPGRNLRVVQHRAISENEIADLVAFLKSLTADSIPDTDLP